MNIPRIKLGLSGKGNAKILNLKCDPALNSLLKIQEGIFPAYHMNKKHCVTIALDILFSKEEIYNLISLSYDLTK